VTVAIQTLIMMISVSDWSRRRNNC
jgi:hypothetical protein